MVSVDGGRQGGRGREYTSHPNSIENPTHSLVTIETLDLWSNHTNYDTIETLDLWNIPTKYGPS
eukprot:SAG11_NODE_22978_length_397_cov_0.778523_1_plen_63_part_01